MLTSKEAAAASFATTKFREGYDTSEVDTLLATVSATLAAYERPTILQQAPGITSSQVVEARFSPTKFRAGYSQDEVDTFLDETVAALRHFEGTL